MRVTGAIARSAAVVDERYPLTKVLSDVFWGSNTTGARRRQKGYDHTSDIRSEIVSEKLCGKSLNRTG